MRMVQPLIRKYYSGHNKQSGREPDDPKRENLLPKFIGGFNSQFAYKNFDLNMNFSFATGHYIYNRLLQSTLTPNRGYVPFP